MGTPLRGFAHPTPAGGSGHRRSFPGHGDRTQSAPRRRGRGAFAIYPARCPRRLGGLRVPRATPGISPGVAPDSGPAEKKTVGWAKACKAVPIIGPLCLHDGHAAARLCPSYACWGKRALAELPGHGARTQSAPRRRGRGAFEIYPAQRPRRLCGLRVPPATSGTRHGVAPDSGPAEKKP